MHSIYLSVPVAISNRDGFLRDTMHSLKKINEDLSIEFWRPGFMYKDHVSNTDVFVFTHPTNGFKFNKESLPSGVIREYERAKALGKKILLAYRTASDGIKFYEIDDSNHFISGIVGTTNSLFIHLDKLYQDSKREVSKVTAETFDSLEAYDKATKEHSIDLRKNVQRASYDRRLLL
jgi:hypothetical protein